MPAVFATLKLADGQGVKKLVGYGNRGTGRQIGDMAVPTGRPLADRLFLGRPQDRAGFHQMHLGGYRHIPLMDDDEKPNRIVSVRTVVDYLAARLTADDLRHDA